MEARDLQWQESYHRVSRVLPMLTKRELDIIGDVADEFAKKDGMAESVNAADSGIRPLSEEELYARIEKSLAQADRGEVRDAEEFEAEFDAELKAAYGL